MFDVLQQLVSMFIQFWIELSKQKFIKMTGKGQEELEKNDGKIEEGQGYFPVEICTEQTPGCEWEISPVS